MNTPNVGGAMVGSSSATAEITVIRGVPRIQRVRLVRFKRFEDESIDLRDNIVFAGPNNAGKTTILQAIAAWELAFRRWIELSDFNPRKGGYTWQPVERLAFSAVPLADFALLFHRRRTNETMAIELLLDARSIGMEFHYDSPGQVRVRPTASTKPEDLRAVRERPLRTTFVPTMSGLAREERRFADKAALDDFLAQGKPGEVLRNLLVIANRMESAWPQLTRAIKRLFDVELLPPQLGAVLRVEYRREGGEALDIGSAGSGFQQVLMLLALLHTRIGDVILLDEPDAHLHVILQHTIYQELKRIAALYGSQIIAATHSEAILDAVDPTEICVILHRPRALVSNEEKRKLGDALRMIRNTDLMLANAAPGILYLEGSTDLAILRAWANVMDHPSRSLFESPRFLWRPVTWEVDEGAPGSQARKHFEALKLAEPSLRALEMIDGDSVGNQQATPITGEGYQKTRWRRYEIESYLFHPAALRRFAEQMVGAAGAAALDTYLADNQPPAWLRDPLGDHPFLVGTKARSVLLPPALAAAGLPEFPYTRFDEIAAVMLPEEIHPEVIEKLDAICKALQWDDREELGI
jgi:predicted ATPase